MANQYDNIESNEEITTQSNNDSIINSTEIVKDSMKKNKTFNFVCILSLIWNTLCVVGICVAFFFMVATYFGMRHEDPKINLLLITFLLAVMAVMLYTNLLTMLGVYKMIKGDVKGYSYFIEGNGIFLVMVALSIFGNGYHGSNIGSGIALFIISAIFRLIFKEYKNKIMNL